LCKTAFCNRQWKEPKDGRKEARANKKCGREAAAIQTDDFLEIILLRLVRAVKEKYGWVKRKVGVFPRCSR